VPESLDDETAMRLAISLAHAAAAAGETPVGAVVVKAGKVIGTGHERTRATLDLVAHAEVEALRSASQRLRSAQLAGCTLYTTVEPCVLCGYAIRRAGVGRVVYGVAAGQAGAVTSRYNILTDADMVGWPAAPDIVRGVLAAECGDALRRVSPENRSVRD
jgi:tRNA(adenine34) deaminase